MLDTHARTWWMFLLRGVAAVIFGLVTLFAPSDIVLSTLILIFAAYLLIDGGFSIGYALTKRTQDRWWVALIEGVISVLAGIAAFLYPGLTALMLLYILAMWAIFTGMTELWLAYDLRRSIDNEWFMALSGILSVVFGVLLILFPGTGIIAVLWMVGIYAVTFGVLLIVLSFRMRNHKSEPAEIGPYQNTSNALR